MNNKILVLRDEKPATGVPHATENVIISAIAMLWVGWDRGKRVRGNLIYVIIENGKVIIEHDGSGVYSSCWFCPLSYRSDQRRYYLPRIIMT